MRHLAPLAAVVALAGCGTARTTSSSPPMVNHQVRTAHLVEERGVAVAPEDTAALRDAAERALLRHDGPATFHDGFAPGGDLIVLYRVTAVEPGNRFLRCLSLGLGAGEGSVDVSATFRDASGLTIGATTVHAELDAGVGIDAAFAAAGREVGRYAVANFLARGR